MRENALHLVLETGHATGIVLAWHSSPNQLAQLLAGERCVEGELHRHRPNREDAAA